MLRWMARSRTPLASNDKQDAKLRRQPSRSVGKTVSQNPHATIRSEAQSF